MAPTALTRDLYIRLFRGRADARGGWDGRCIRTPITPASFVGHLTSGERFGVYPSFNIDGVAHCIWGCTDIDHTDDPQQAQHLRNVFASVGVVAHVERTAHGFHIWVFFDTLIASSVVRSMFLAAHQVADIPPTEVNPKQTVLAVGQVGNYVRLPYPHYYKDGITERYMIDTAGESLTPEEFTEYAATNLTSGDLATELASYYIPPPQPVVAVGAPTSDMTSAAAALTPLGKVIWRDGPLEGGDRSSKLQHLVHECAKAGINPADALMLLKDADQRWGKYSTRGEAGQMELHKMLARVYGANALTPST